MARRRDRTAAVVVGVLAAVMLAGAAAGFLGGDADDADGARPAPVSRSDPWVSAAEDAFAPFEELPAVVRVLDDWRRGAADPEQVAAQLAALDQALAGVEPALVALGPHPDAPLAAPLHLATARLYEVAVDVEAVAVGMPAGEAALEVDLIARRLQVLANRVFDRGRAAVGEGPAADLGPDVVVHRPDPVPVWSDEGLAGAFGPPGSVAPSGPVRDWVDLARSAVPDDLADLDALLAAGDPVTLLDLAGRTEAAVLALRARPDPDGGDRSTRVLLGLLVRVEAARLAAVAADTGRAELAGAARSVAAVAADPAMWDSDLGPLP